MSGQRALLVVNRQSRKGKEDLSEGVQCLRQRGFLVHQEVLDEPDCLPGLIRDRCLQMDLVIVAGGDGTINAALEPLLACGLPLGILPLGTANDLARTLGIPIDLRAACDVIAAGRLRRIDLGWVNGKHFLNVASLGISVEVARRLSPETKRRLGKLGYLHRLISILKERAPSFYARISCNGRTIWMRTIQISVANGRYHGGGITVAEDAAIDDSRLDLYALRPLNIWQLLTLAPAWYQGRHGRSRKKVRFLHGQEIEIRTERTMPIDTDGELTTATPALFRLVPRALTVYVPPDHSPGRET